MLALTSEQSAALAARAVVRRFFVWIEPRNLITGEVEPVGFWDDAGVVEHEGRTFIGNGTLAGVSSLAGTSQLSIPGLSVTLVGTSEAVNATIRGYDGAQAAIEVSLGLFDPASRALVGGLIKRFVGFIDEIDVKTPAAGEAGAIVLTCESTSRQLTIKRTGTRSQATQQERSEADAFYDYTAAQSQQPLYFGRKGPRS